MVTFESFWPFRITFASALHLKQFVLLNGTQSSCNVLTVQSLPSGEWLEWMASWSVGNYNVSQLGA